MPATLKKVTSTNGVTDPYVKRLLTNILNREPLTVLKGSPEAIKRSIRGLSDAQLRRQPEKGKWSIAQIISHLCDAELAMTFRLRMAVAQSGINLQAWDENRWAEHLGYEKTDPRQRLGLYTSLREDNLNLLRSLKKDQLERFGIHEERGRETVERMAHLMAGHDVNHVKRIGEIRTILVKKKTARRQ